VGKPEQEVLSLGLLTPSEVFQKIRNYLAGAHIGATRDHALLDQVLLCLFAKLHLFQRPTHTENEENRRSAAQAYPRALRELRLLLGPDALPRATLTLDARSIDYVDKALSLLDLSAPGADLVGDAYQCFLGSELRGQEGQFFTPTPAIRLLLACIDPCPGERVIDPAAGAGGFLFATFHHLAQKGVPVRDIQRLLYGVEKDAYLARLARMRVSLLTQRPTCVSIGDSLAWTTTEPSSFMPKLKPGAYDVVLTNPPFGTKIIAASDSLRREFLLAHRWVAKNPNGKHAPTSELLKNSPPQVLFVERCLSLVKPGGRIGMVVPESILSGKNYRHVVEFIRQSATIDAIIGMPDALFKTSGKGGTHTKTALLCLRKNDGKDQRRNGLVFMAEAAWCGHDSRGRRIPRDDTPFIARNYLACRQASGELKVGPLGFTVASKDLKPGILAPRAYDPDIAQLLQNLEKSHALVRFGDLMQQGTLALCTGDEVGKLAYGTGEVPFVRTSDLSTWEIKVDPKHGVSRSIFEAVKTKQDVQAGDILMVRDGTYLIGTCALVTKHDVEIVLQSHIYKIRVHHNELLDPYLLLAILSSPIVQRQIRAHSQTQDIINSLGNRINELILPIPRDPIVRHEISQLVERVIRERVGARELAREIVESVASPWAQSG
jgi:type I restriction enzyme M protein